MKNRGFTLIELMVSVTIFIIVMTVSLGALLSISAADRKAETVKSVMNNLNFALESMTRTIRTGADYHCGTTGTLTIPRDCDSPGSHYFGFLSSEAAQGTVVYCRGRSTDSVCDSSGDAILRSLNGAGNFAPITAPEVVIENLTFYVVGSVSQAGSDPTNSQPKVVVTLNGTVEVSTTQTTDFALQTAITQRLYDQ